MITHFEEFKCAIFFHCFKEIVRKFNQTVQPTLIYHQIIL